MLIFDGVLQTTILGPAPYETLFQVTVSINSVSYRGLSKKYYFSIFDIFGGVQQKD